MSLSDRIKKPLVIVNPMANGGRALERCEPVIYSLRSAGFNCDVKIPGTREETIDIVRKDRMHEFIIVYSGDGGVNAAMKGLMQNKHRKDKVLVPLPGGSANNIAEECGYGSLDNVCDSLINGTEEEMGVWRVNEDEEYFLGFASIGFGAAVLEERNKERFFKGKMAYVAGALRTIFRYTPKNMWLKIDKEEVDKDVYIGIISNIRFYGDRMMIAPYAKADGDFMDLCFMESLGTIIQNLPAVYNGKHIDNKGVYHAKARSLIADSSEKFQLEIDGESRGEHNRLVTEYAGRIRVLVFNGSSY